MVICPLRHHALSEPLLCAGSEMCRAVGSGPSLRGVIIAGHSGVEGRWIDIHGNDCVTHIVGGRTRAALTGRGVGRWHRGDWVLNRGHVLTGQSSPQGLSGKRLEAAVPGPECSWRDVGVGGWEAHRATGKSFPADGLGLRGEQHATEVTEAFCSVSSPAKVGNRNLTPVSAFVGTKRLWESSGAWQRRWSPSVLQDALAEERAVEMQSQQQWARMARVLHAKCWFSEVFLFPS